MSVAVVAMSACHSDVRTNRCDPFRTPRIAGAPVQKGAEKSAHAPYILGDCAVCHIAPTPAAGEPADQRPYALVVRPVNQHCVSCHRELFRMPPPNHPPEQAFCTSCHDPHASRQKSLLLDDDVGRACLDYPPPYPEKPVVAEQQQPVETEKAKPAATTKKKRKTSKHARDQRQ